MVIRYTVVPLTYYVGFTSALWTGPLLHPSVTSSDGSYIYKVTHSCFHQNGLILIKSFHIISSLSAGKVLETVSPKFNTYINKKYKVFRVSIR